MNIADMQAWRQLKELRAKVAEFERAIDAFEGELMELGALRAKHYAAKFRANELAEQIGAASN